MEALVDSVLLYGADVCGCCRQLQEVEQVQLRGYRVFLGVNHLHPKTSLQMEMDMLPLEWAAKKRSMAHWFRIMRMEESRLLRLVALEAAELGRKVKWIEDLHSNLAEIGWDNVDPQDLEAVSLKELGHMINCGVWRAVIDKWETDLESKPKLSVLREIYDRGYSARCVEVEDKKMRRILTKLQGGTAELRIETGRWRGLRREDRVCTICCDGEIEEAEHLILRCKVAGEERKNLLEEMKKVDGDLQDKSEKEQLAAILDGAVRQIRVRKAVERIWDR